MRGEQSSRSLREEALGRGVTDCSGNQTSGFSLGCCCLIITPLH